MGFTYHNQVTFRIRKVTLKLKIEIEIARETTGSSKKDRLAWAQNCKRSIMRTKYQGSKKQNSRYLH
jgi:hypothetical protein